MTELAPIIRRPATYQDVLDAPPGFVAELVRETLHLQPRPRSRHAHVAFGLAGQLFDPFGRGIRGPGGWWFASEPELHLVDAVLVPDLCGWRRERMPEFPDVAAFDLAPDWICEILSPSTRKFDLTEKREIYARSGVPHLWFVDPDAGTLEVFTLSEEGWHLVAAVAEEDIVSLAPFEAIAFPLAGVMPSRDGGSLGDPP
ncbi:MAG: Uma2 family endonuclease [Pseudomonadota bacterium]